MEQISLNANILWQLWKARNKSVFEQQRGETRDIVLRAQQEWIEFEEAMQQETKMKQGGVASKQNEQTV